MRSISETTDWPRASDFFSSSSIAATALRTFLAAASGEVTSPALASLTARIAELTGALRATHLTAHLEVTALLSPEQVDRYDALRRYRGSPSER